MPGRANSRHRALAVCASRLVLVAAQPLENGASWIQIAYEGRWEGYARGGFELGKDDLQQMVDNFHAHPSFKPGAELATTEQLASCSFDVIPFDWRHLSTAPATAAPLELQVAQAWACDIKVIAGAGGAELWALCRYLEPMGTMVREGKVHWTSITADPHFIDPETAEDRGWYLEAVAFTNDPFLQGMKVAADRAGGVTLYRDFDPCSPEEALECLRGLLKLPATAELGAVMAELVKLRTWATSGGAPAGVDIGALVGSLRQIFNLPTLASVDQVFAAADGLLAALAESAPSPQSDRGPVGLAKEATVALNPHVSKMIALMSGMLGTLALSRPPATDDDAVELVRDGVASTKVKLEGAASSTAGLSAVLQALGVEDVPGATKKIAEMFKSVDQLEKAMPELKALRDSQESDEEDGAEKDVGEAMKAHRMPETARPALIAMRTGGHPKKELEKRKLAKAEFFKAYPKLDPRGIALTQPTGLAGNSGGRVEGGGTTVATQRVELGIDGNEVVDLSEFDGNNTERALAFLEKRGDFKIGKKTLSRPEKFSLASKLLRQPNVVGIER